eukprot:365280-Chlamydomonas_euryale.AAC.1
MSWGAGHAARGLGHVARGLDAWLLGPEAGGWGSGLWPSTPVDRPVLTTPEIPNHIRATVLPVYTTVLFAMHSTAPVPQPGFPLYSTALFPLHSTRTCTAAGPAAPLRQHAAEAAPLAQLDAPRAPAAVGWPLPALGPMPHSRQTPHTGSGAARENVEHTTRRKRSGLLMSGQMHVVFGQHASAAAAAVGKWRASGWQVEGR